MKTFLRKSLFILLLLSIFMLSSACCEEKRNSFSELKSTIPSTWEYEWTNKKGKTQSFSAPIDLPDVDKIPILKVGKVQDFVLAPDVLASLSGAETSAETNPDWDDRLFLRFDKPEEIDFSLPNEEISDQCLAFLKKLYPRLNDIVLERFYYDYSEASFYELFEGVPFYTGENYLSHHPISSTKGYEDIPGCLIKIRFSKKHNYITFTYNSVEEKYIVKDDVKLLPFSEISAVLEKRVRAGYASDVTGLALGYMLYTDPSNTEEFYLAPVWVTKGLFRSDLTIPFPKSPTFTEPIDVPFYEIKGYRNTDSIIINAVTGEVLDYSNTRADRMCMYEIPED